MNDLKGDPSLVRIPGILCGAHGMVGKCVVICWTEQSSAGKTYTRSRISHDPPELPDGEYIIQFSDEQSVRTSKHRRMWALVFLAPPPYSFVDGAPQRFRSDVAGQWRGGPLSR